MKLPDITLPLLFLGKLSRDIQKQTKHPKVNWWFHSRLEEAFLYKFPSHKKSYLTFMTNEEKKWEGAFTELFMRHTIATYVLNNCMLESIY